MRSIPKLCNLSEKHIIVLSGICGLLNLISCISLAIVWTYWSDTLNNCPETNCGCIFFGHLRSTTFVGGQPIWCRSIIYFTLIATIVSFVISVYFFIKLRTTPKNIPSRVSQTDDDIPSRSRIRIHYSGGFRILCLILAIVIFIHASILTEGYSTTCKEYKTLVSKYLRANGDLSDLVMDRLSCGTMYDFLDYLHPDAIVREPYLPQYYHHRTFRINTGSMLIISLVSSWINVIIWTVLTVFVGLCK